MLMNIYLVYLSTIISSYIFNTYNFINNKIDVEELKKRKIIFKKDLCGKTKKIIKKGEMVPTIYYLASSLCSFFPIYNLYVPEKSKRTYNEVDMKGLALEYFKEANEQELIHRYSNGMAIKILELNGFNIPEEYKNVQVNIEDFDVDPDTKKQIDLVVKSMFSFTEEEIGVENINPIGDRELYKKIRKIKSLNKDKVFELKQKEVLP